MMQIAQLDVFLFRAPAVPPVRTSFGLMHDRPALLLRVTDPDGAIGWGEVWCNFPTGGAEHRARLALAYARQLVTARAWRDPAEAFETLSAQLAVLMLQAGEPGPLQQVLAGVDIALWDLFARRQGVPLWQALGASKPAPVAVYASGINPDAPEVLAAAKQAEGYRAFKLKVGFGLERDCANLAAMREALGAQAVLMVDANQAWDLPTALAAAPKLAQYDLRWLEEPLRADRPLAEWAQLAREQPLWLAAGENLAGLPQFEAHVASAGLAVMQPDVGKWGGLTGCRTVGERAIAAGLWFCPHWLGAGIGLMASMHLKAALGGPGYVEVDANPNPLRDGLAQPAWAIQDGCVQLSNEPGLGVVPDLAACARWQLEIPQVGL